MDQTIHGRRLDVRLFLEGIECDVTSVKVSCGVNQPATGTITIPSADAVHRLLPRTLVHVFYFDSRWELGTKAGSTPKHSNIRTDAASEAAGYKDTLAEDKEAGVSKLLIDKDNWYNWKLLFVGEVMGYSFKKIGGRRDIVLSCQDHTSYWDNCRVYWGKKRSSVFNSYKTAIFSGATQLYRGKSKVDSSGDLLRLLQARPSAMPNVPGLMGGIFSVLEAATGCYAPDAKKQFHGCNDFLSQAEIRLKLTRQIGASTEDDTSATFTSSKSFKRYLRKVSKQVKHTATFMQFVNMLCSKIYHVWHSQLAPPYFKEGDKVITEWVISGKAKYSYGGTLSKVQKAAEETYKLGSKQTSETLKRRGTVTQKAGQSSQIGTDFYKRKPDGTLDGESHEDFDTTNKTKGIMSVAATGVAGVDSTTVKKVEEDPFWLKGDAIKAKLMKKSDSSGDKSLRRRADRIQQAYRCLAAARFRAAELVQGQVANNYASIAGAAAKIKHDSDNLFFIRRKLECYLKGIGAATGRKVIPQRKEVDLRDRLYTTYFHPDLYMCPPPRCNVIFPDQIQAIQFSRNWMSEITRLWLHGKTASGRNKKDCYFSPNAQLLAGPSVTDCAQAVKKGGSFVMKHEKYTGIIPSIMGMGDGDIFKKLHKKELKEAKKKWKEEKGDLKGFDSASVSGEAKFSPQPHLQRAANYMFFAQRYGTRQMAVTCRYSPQLVAGMPCLILDPDRQRSRIVHAIGGDGENAHEMRRGKDAGIAASVPKGTHYVGLIAEIIHVIDVEGGAQTVVSVAKVRAHTEDAGLFGDTGTDGKITTERSYTRHGRSKVKPPAGEEHTAYITKTEGSAGGVVVSTSPESASQVVGSKQFRKGARYKIIPRKVGDNYDYTNKGSGDLGMSVGLNSDGKPDKSLGRADGGVNAVKVDVYRYRSWPAKDKVSFTFEGTLMPPWLSSIYHPGSIGPKYYQKMFGCSSVLDKAPIIFRDGTEEKPMNLSTSTGKPVEANESGMAVISVPFKTPPSVYAGGTEYTELRIPAELTDPAKTTEAAANQLAEVWLSLKEIGAATDMWCDGYVDRQYATMVDVMGNMNPGFMPKIYDPQKLVDDEMRRGPPTRGFHGDAYGPFAELKDWDGEEIVPTLLPKLAEGTKGLVKPRDIDKDIDPRWHRHQAVRKYIMELRDQGFRDTGGNYEEETDAAKRKILDGYDHPAPKPAEA